MSVLSKEDLLNRVNSVLGNNTSDDALSLIEDITDTYDDALSKQNDKENWKEKYEQNDKAWREKYRNRFFGKSDDKEDDKPLTDDDDKDIKRNFEDLFTVEA